MNSRIISTVKKSLSLNFKKARQNVINTFKQNTITEIHNKYSYIDNFVENKQYKLAIDNISNELLKDSNNQELLMKMAIAHIGSNDFDYAEMFLNQIHEYSLEKAYLLDIMNVHNNKGTNNINDYLKFNFFNFEYISNIELVPLNKIRILIINSLANELSNTPNHYLKLKDYILNNYNTVNTHLISILGQALIRCKQEPDFEIIKITGTTLIASDYIDEGTDILHELFENNPNDTDLALTMTQLYHIADSHRAAIKAASWAIHSSNQGSEEYFQAKYLLIKAIIIDDTYKDYSLIELTNIIFQTILEEATYNLYNNNITLSEITDLNVSDTSNIINFIVNNRDLRKYFSPRLLEIIDELFL